ncbi:MAG: sensor histidine kinase [Gammaproteobacteria bacterium]
MTTLKSNKKRHYRSSSSFKVATLFAVLLAFAVIALSISIYLFYQQSETELSQAFVLLSVISILALLIMGVMGYLISVFVVTRINRIANTAQEIITTGDLTKRIEIDSRWDDLSFLGDVLNEMLEKIETLMEGVQHITDTVAHDLRTPLARLRNKLEQNSNKSGLEKYDEIEGKASLVKDVDSLLKTFNALLSLSSLESGRQGSRFEEFDLGKVVQDAVDLYMPLAEEKNQTFTVDSKAISYKGDRDLFFQVIANLLDNAIKFTQHNGVIKISLENSSNEKIIIIQDNGPGIPHGSVEKAFDRFYRDQEQQHIEGSGLGLSLVNAVLKLHKASISLEDNQPGLKVIISL